MYQMWLLSLQKNKTRYIYSICSLKPTEDGGGGNNPRVIRHVVALFFSFHRTTGHGTSPAVLLLVMGFLQPVSHIAGQPYSQSASQLYSQSAT